MRRAILSRLSFVAAFCVAILVMTSCAVPAAPGQPPVNPPTQPPVTVLVVVTATTAPPTATATAKPAVVEPTTTPTGIPPTATATGKPPTVTATGKPPTATATGKPPTATATRTRTPTPTRTPTSTPEATTRDLFSTYLLNAGKAPSPFGDKGDILVNTGGRLPPGCEVFKVLGREYSRFGKPMSASAESMTDAMSGWSVTKQNNDPRDYGVKIHWWYNAGGFVSLRVHYVVRQPWNVDCLVAGKMQTGP